MSGKILLTGAPGVGKTTTIRKIAEKLGAEASGFYTEEKKEAGRRVGFDIITLNGRRAPLSHTNIPGKMRVGRYGVDIASLDAVAVPAIEEALERKGAVIIDEIGKMELFSKKFREAVEKAFASSRPVVAVIMLKPDPFADALKRRSDIELIEVTVSNRDSLPAKIAAKIQSHQ